MKPWLSKSLVTLFLQITSYTLFLYFFKKHNFFVHFFSKNSFSKLCHRLICNNSYFIESFSSFVWYHSHLPQIKSAPPPGLCIFPNPSLELSSWKRFGLWTHSPWQNTGAQRGQISLIYQYGSLIVDRLCELLKTMKSLWSQFSSFQKKEDWVWWSLCSLCNPKS